MLRLEGIEAGYGRCAVLRGLNLEVGKGETVALVGANGAGKTTVLRTISALIRPRAGRVLFDGKDISHLKPHEIVCRGLSHVPERRGIFANLTVYENLVVGGYTQRLTSKDFEEVYTLFPVLRERAKQSAGTLSGGEQQMLAISRALLSRPKLLLLDEPSLGLAPLVTKKIFETIQRISSQGTTVLLVEQNAHAALKISQRAYVLEVGEVRFAGSSKELQANDEIRRAYLGE
ncbi:ABC transporter ATP-binding protein [bacterium]|nr:ABC transporter ATP-binding protein [bacterium]